MIKVNLSKNDLKYNFVGGLKDIDTLQDVGSTSERASQPLGLGYLPSLSTRAHRELKCRALNLIDHGLTSRGNFDTGINEVNN